MSFAVQQTPQRPLPGAYIATPAQSRQQQPSNVQPLTFTNTTSAVQNNAQQNPYSAPAQQSRALQSSNAIETLKPIERGARTINQALVEETRYPELDSYVGRLYPQPSQACTANPPKEGISSDYEISSDGPWQPFQKTKVYDIPERIFDQYNRAQVSTIMGLFAEINHAWITIDNALYLWDYTLPNPDLIGFEDQPNSITAVKLVIPRAGVFVPAITHLLVVATTLEMFLVGIACQTTQTGSRTVALYQTKMHISIRGLDINVIEGSAKTGRIFFSGRGDNDVYELTYQQEEKWFKNRCGKTNQTTNAIVALTPAIPFTQKAPHEHVVQLVVDDSRNLLYTLSSRSNIRTFHLQPPNTLVCVINRNRNDIFGNVHHMVSRTDLVGPKASIVSISPISSREASKLHLMATTSTGCRLFLSATASYSWSAGNSSSPPTSMQVQHVKFPPSQNPQSPRPQQQQSNQITNYQGGPGIDTQSRSLDRTRTAHRYPPGYFLCFVPGNQQGTTDLIFLSTPDTGRIAQEQDPSQRTLYREIGAYLDLGSRVEDLGLVSAPFAAAPSPAGFGNELAVQYDVSSTEIAILTNTGIHTIRRRRLVDILAAMIRQGGGGQGIEAEIRKFILYYGRGEAAATALAVACGQGQDVTSDSRLANITDPEILERARKMFIEHGGKPILNENSIVDQAVPAIDTVRPSPRHEGLALYISRLVRSIWKAPLIYECITPTGGLSVVPAVSLQKLQNIQRDLTQLHEFLNSNKSFIEGLAGPEALTRVSTKQEEVALQAEHRALHSLVVLISDIIEGISFVLVLFDERTHEIVLSLADTIRQQVRQLTYEGLFATTNGKELAKELVKAIVNRNIANGSNVDTIAEALRRRCGSFCSADDVVIFKAQEQLKRASEAGSASEYGRNLLNESLRLFQQVAASLSTDQLQWAVNQFVSMQFYAGAIQLALSVAKESDRGNRALTWITDGRPEKDPREAIFNGRKQCYDLVHQIISAVDQNSSQAPETIDGQYTLAAKRRSEAYSVIDNSDDEVFQTDLYDWYLAQGWSDRLLEVQSPYVITYLRRKSADDVAHADLLWRYYAQSDKFHDAASVQLQLAKSGFDLFLEKRIEYLGRAKANASVFTSGVGRQPRQLLLHEVSDLLDVANIQDDLLQRLKADSRISPERRPEVLKGLNGQILSLTELYNGYADQASYFDLCILIYQASSYENETDIKATWQNLLESTHKETVNLESPLPYEAVIEKVRTLGNRLNLSETTFPIPFLVAMLEKYAYEYQRGIGPSTWIIDLFLDLNIAYESILPVLEQMLHNDEAPFRGKNRHYIADDLLYLIQRWFQNTERAGGRILGGESNSRAVSDVLGELQGVLRDEGRVEECRVLRRSIEQILLP
ncbi:MAG: hypothetical protein M1812_006319 [Candelaria pacifica]|nr:MAG: hypothetical protein M1812_006319 [Candelaria pacifica]